MVRFVKKVNNIQPLTILVKYSVLDVWQVSEYMSVRIICESKRTIKKYRKEKPLSSGLRISVAYLELRETSMMERFCKNS